jgi:tetratricopeptide (TPR) repeat protein
MSNHAQPQGHAQNRTDCHRMPALFRLAIGVLVLCVQVSAQTPDADWQAQVRKYSEQKDWASAMRVVDQQITQAPQDMDVRAWRARVLAWSGNLKEAEQEYLQILQVVKTDPDNWLGLANVYLGESKISDALHALDLAVQLDPSRSDLHMARGRALQAAGDQKKAQLEFREAISLDPANEEARLADQSVRAASRNELRIGQEDNAFNFLYPNYDEWVSLRTDWSKHWSTTFLGNFFQWGPAQAGKFGTSVTGRLPKWGAFTIGGDAGHDSGVIPKREAYFELDHGLKIGERGFVRGFDFTYNQHWYWYSTAKVLALSGVVLAYLPRDWTFSITGVAAQSNFPGLGSQWRPSEIARLGFPITHKEEKQLSGNVFFATGTENFASVDQIGFFSSHTFGGGLRFSLTERQDLSPYAAYQQRSEGRTDATFGLSYGLRF